MNRLDRAINFSLNYSADSNRISATPEEYRELMKILSYPQEYPCPYCKQNHCEHWNGVSWINPNVKSDTKNS